jgi:LmbE family N-acetylglucosaminyl deacetylase
MLKLLCITAHPDDEAGGFGGSLALYSERGVETHVICLTPGQAARNRGAARSDDELAAMRRKEFADSCRILNVSHSDVLNYRDSALDRADLYTVSAELACRIRQIRPQVVATFGPEGSITAHPDHSMASIFATAAFNWAGRSNRFTEQLTNGLRPYRPQKLYYSTAAFTLQDRQPVSLPPATTVVDISKHWEQKIKAFRAHLTQEPLFPIFERNISHSNRRELFHLAAALTPRQAELETDLFTGVLEEE